MAMYDSIVYLLLGLLLLKSRNTKLPSDCNQSLSENHFVEDVATGKLDNSSDVKDPVNPETVIKELASKSQLAEKLIVITLDEPGNGLLCRIERTKKRGTWICKGSKPCNTDRRVVPGLTMAVDNTGDVSPNTDITLARTITRGEDWLVGGFVKLNRAS